MALTAAEQTTLHDEIVGGASPLNAQYLVILGNGQDNVSRAQLLADLLNDKTTNRTVVRESMSGSELFDATDVAEYVLLSDAQKQLWISFTSRDSVNPEIGGKAQQLVQSIFPPAGNTVQALANARLQTVSRAAELGLPAVNANDVLESGVFA